MRLALWLYLPEAPSQEGLAGRYARCMAIRAWSYSRSNVYFHIQTKEINTLKQMITIVENLPTQGSDIAKIAIIRMQELAGRGFTSTIATLGYRTTLGDAYQYFLRQGVIGRELRIFNFYTWCAMRSIRVDPHSVESTQSHTQISWWIVERKTEIRFPNLKVHQYVNLFGQVFMEEYLNADDKIESVMISVYGEPPRQFFGLASVHAWWLEQLVSDVIPAVLICDHADAADALGRIKAPSVYKVLVMHGMHLSQPGKIHSSISANLKSVVNNIGRCDSMVLPTQAQLHDVQARFADGNYGVIGNPIVVSHDPSPPVARDSNLAVVVARLGASKGIKEIIAAFEKIQRARPATRLEIWGTGSQQQELSDLIASRCLDGCIALMGFTDNPGAAFRRASVSLAMSAKEGFSISLAQSLACGTPAVSLKTKYGAEEIVTSGEDGFLVDDEDEFVRKALALLSDPVLVARMSVAGVRNMQRFSPNSIGNLWLDHFKMLLAHPPRCGSILLGNQENR